MLNVRLAGDHNYGKLLFSWLSLVKYMMVSFCAVFFPNEMTWVRSGTEFNQFLRVFLPTGLCSSSYFARFLQKYIHVSVNIPDV